VTSGGELYIYYRLADGAFEHLRPRLQAMQRAVADECGCTATLMQKPDDGTRMEVYRGVADRQAVLDGLVRHLRAMAFDDHLASGSRRHVEYFVCA